MKLLSARECNYGACPSIRCSVPCVSVHETFKKYAYLSSWKIEKAILSRTWKFPRMEILIPNLFCPHSNILDWLILEIFQDTKPSKGTNLIHPPPHQKPIPSLITFYSNLTDPSRPPRTHGSSHTPLILHYFSNSSLHLSKSFSMHVPKAIVSRFCIQCPHFIVLQKRRV